MARVRRYPASRAGAEGIGHLGEPVGALEDPERPVVRDEVAGGDRDERGRESARDPRTGTRARCAETAAAKASEPATIRHTVSSAAVCHNCAGRLEDWTKVYQRVSPENPSYAVLPSMTDVTASSPRCAARALGPCSGVRRTQRRSVRRPSGLSVPYREDHAAKGSPVRRYSRPKVRARIRLVTMKPRIANRRTGKVALSRAMSSQPDEREHAGGCGQKPSR